MALVCIVLLPALYFVHSRLDGHFIFALIIEYFIEGILVILFGFTKQEKIKGFDFLKGKIYGKTYY